MTHATFTFHGSLNDFLPRASRHSTLTRPLGETANLKDMAESCNVPHPEMECLTVNGLSVGFDYTVSAGDDIHIYPLGAVPPAVIALPLRPPYLGKPRFVLDTHLGRLAAYLRMAGFDTRYKNFEDDDVLAQIADEDGRVLLTRDIGLLKRGRVVYGYFVRELEPAQQLIEIVRRFQLAEHLNSEGRCTRCNGALHPIAKAQAMALLPNTDSLQFYESFYQCEACNQVYWPGSHYERLQALLQEAVNTP